MEEEWYDYCEPMRRGMNKWMSKCQDKYIVVQPIGMRRKAEREKGERESIWWRYRQGGSVAKYRRREGEILESGTRYEAVRLEGDRKDKEKDTQQQRAVYYKETGANGDPIYERDKAKGDMHRLQRNDRVEGIMGERRYGLGVKVS